ncbi:hypothetical protein D3C86_1981590 [compost metagenome]
MFIGSPRIRSRNKSYPHHHIKHPITIKAKQPRNALVSSYIDKVFGRNYDEPSMLASDTYAEYCRRI